MPWSSRSSSSGSCRTGDAIRGETIRGRGLLREPFSIPGKSPPAGSNTLPILLERENDVVMPFLVRGGMKLRLFLVQQIVDRVMDIGERLIHVRNGGIRVFVRLRHGKNLAGIPNALPGRLDVLFLHDFFHLDKNRAS